MSAKSVLHPVVTGAGEVIRGLKIVNNMDDVSDAVKIADRIEDAAEIIDGACFVSGTPILSAEGYISIENISEGDFIWSENPETGEKGLKQVVRTFKRETKELVYVRLNGETITATPTHPFYVLNEGWTEAICLKKGDSLVLQNGNSTSIERVFHKVFELPIMVYNLEVEDFHTYYVGEISVLVHNMCGGLRIGKPSVPEGSIRIRVDTRKVNSQEFKDFIRSTGQNFKSSEWKYKMETWITPDGKSVERHYWYNKVTGKTYHHL